MIRLFMQITKLDYKNNGLLSLLRGAHGQELRYIGAANRVYAEIAFLIIRAQLIAQHPAQD